MSDRSTGLEKAISGRFAVEWRVFNRVIPLYEDHLMKWIYPLQKEDFRGKDVLDVGCGMGRNPYFFLLWGSSSLVGIDVDDDILKSARRTLSKFQNCSIEKCSVYDIKYKEQFDIVSCLGVLHHLHDSRLALQKIIECARKGGKIIIWVYGYEGNRKKLRLLRVLRSIFKFVNSEVVATFALIPAFLLRIYLEYAWSKNPYYKFIRKYSFRYLHLIVHDQLVPTISHYYTYSELKDLVSSVCQYPFEIYDVSRMSYSVLITKDK